MPITGSGAVCDFVYSHGSSNSQV